MPKYFYTVRDSTGKKISNSEEAANQEDLVTRLQARDFFVVNVIAEAAEPKGKALTREEQDTVNASGSAFKFKRNRISNNDLVLLCRQLATLLGAGVTILKCLDIISKQVASKKLYQVLRSLMKNMEQGLSLHEAMAKHPDVFSELWINLVESGEASGNLAVILARLASYLEMNAAFRAKIISALVYPAILTIAGLSALLFITMKIVPIFAQVFSNFNIKLPMMTVALVMVSIFIRKAWIFFLIGGVIGFRIFKSYIKTDQGRLKFENFLFHIPVFKDFFRAVIVERFSSNMATLLESGVPILYALEISEHSVGNLTIAEVVHKIKDEVREGKSLAGPMEQSGFFEPMVTQMVAIGEEVGELPQMFTKVNAFYQEYLSTCITRFTSMFEPIMILIMGAVVGIIVLAMFLPIFQISQIGSVTR